ncbi:MAG TPA: potassium channel family protein [Thermoanaerobaculia bacterium]|nr:potassium channel family protein [Thermoanaerobaculia bacterium]
MTTLAATARNVPADARERVSPGYQVFMLLLCVLSLVVLVLESAFRNQREIANVLEWADDAVRFEDKPESNIRTADDAVWWAFATITTVGYGDRYPVSTEGRFVAAMLMTAGVGLFGAFSAALAAWFLAPEEEAIEVELHAMRETIAEIRTLLDERL